MAFIWAACAKEELVIKNPQFEIHPDFGLPVAKLTMLADRLIANYNQLGYIDVDENGSISMIYRDTLPPLRADNLLNIQGFEYKDTLNLSTPQYNELLGTGSVTIESSKLHSLKSSQGDKLDSLRFQSGKLKMEITSQGNFPISGYIKIKNADFTDAFVLDFSSDQTPVNIQQEINFENLLLLFQNVGNQTNALGVEYEITFTASPNPSPHPIYINLSISDFSVKAAGGYIAPRFIDFGANSIELEVFRNPSVKNVRIEDPRLNFNFENDYGLGMGIQIHSIVGKNPMGGTFIVSSQDINQLPPIAGATQNGIPAHSTLSINNELMNPTVTDLLFFGPDNIIADFGVTINPENFESLFITNENELRTNFEIFIPLFGSISDFLLRDTTAVNFSDLVKDVEGVSEIEEASIRLHVNNGFPFDAGANLVFVDSLYQPIYSIFDSPELIFGAAPVNLEVPVQDPNYGRAVGTTKTTVDFILPRQKVLELKHARYAIVSVYGNTAGNGAHPIRLFSNDAFDIKLGARVKLNINSEQ